MRPPAVASLLDLTGRVAVVTGASGTIGAGIARRLHEAGAAVVVHAGSRPEAAEALVSELGDRATAVAGDVERDAAAICRAAVAAFGALHVVVNNAGLQPVAPLTAIGTAEAAEMLRVNVGGVIAMTREAAALMATGRCDRQRQLDRRAAAGPRPQPLRRFEGRRDHAHARRGARTGAAGRARE